MRNPWQELERRRVVRFASFARGGHCPERRLAAELAGRMVSADNTSWLFVPRRSPLFIYLVDIPKHGSSG